jgi:FXSXX-COOH protein
VPDVPSAVRDLRDVPLDAITGSDAAAALGRVLPTAPAVPVAAFSSAI